MAAASEFLSAAVIVAEWQKNQRETVRVALETFNDRPIVNLRIWYRPEGSDDLRPGKSGLAMGAQHLPALASAINRALEIAVQRGDVTQGDADGR